MPTPHEILIRALTREKMRVIVMNITRNISRVKSRKRGENERRIKGGPREVRQDTSAGR